MRKIIIFKRFLFFLMTLMFVAGVVGCGGKDEEATSNTTSTYSISGTVSGAIQEGVTINLTGASTETTTTDADGKYSFTGLASGNYTVTPVLSGYVFTPASKAVTVSVSDMAADFEAIASSAPTYSISGTVSGAIQEGVRIDLTGDNTGSVITGSDGTYAFTGLLAGAYTVTPYLSRYGFEPDHRDVNLSANSTGNDFTASASILPYAQADLAGPWIVHRLEKAEIPSWGRYNVTIASNGTVNFDACEESSGDTSCPTTAIVWTITPGNGVITATADGNPTDSHFTMTSNKTFIAGTSSGSSQLFVVQKKVDGTVYRDSDLYNKTMVFHQLKIGEEDGWAYGTLTTNGSGQITVTSVTDEEGTDEDDEALGTFQVSPDGTVTIDGMTETWKGFLSPDKKTIVAVGVTEGEDLNFMVINITGRTYTAGSLPEGTIYGHVLGTGLLEYWAHFTGTIDSSGEMTFDDWVDNSNDVDTPEPTTPTIDSTGKITMSGTTYHGQMSDDGYFTVGIQVDGTTPNFVNSIIITTK